MAELSAQPDLVAAEIPEDDDADSALGDDVASSTATIASSILEYRTIQGRTYHSERHNTEYFTPNDEQQRESVDISHHYLTILLDGKLHLVPLGEGPHKVLDVGTGTGIWAIDYADANPLDEVIGTDLSPIQPKWVPPNLKFEIDDATQPWTWAADTFDLVHMRYLFGAIPNWDDLLAQAFRCTKPGGYTQTCELDVMFSSDDHTTDAEDVLAMWDKLYTEGGKKFGRPFTVVRDDLQRIGMEKAGFTDLVTHNYKLPIGGWAADEKLAEVGKFTRLAMENDIEGYTLLLWINVLGWPKPEWQIFLMQMRQLLKNRRVHGYMTLRYMYGKKPVA